ncbi:MAG: hypothetical protein ACK5UB_10090 [Pseudanabaena sp.]
MIENTEIPFEVSSNENMPDDIPLGNYAPLIVPSSLGQSFLQPKFIYPLGAVSLFNPDNAEINDGFEPLSNSFDDSPFFNQPLSPTSLPSVDGQTINQSNIQAKSLSSQNNLQRKQQTNLSSNTSTNNKSIQRQPLNNSPASQTNEIQRQPDISPIDSISQGDHNIQQEPSFPPVDNITHSIQREAQTQFEALSIDNISHGDQTIQQVQRFSESPALDSGSQSDRTIQDSDSNIIQTPQTASIQRQSDISTGDNISQGNQNIQRFSESPALDSVSQGDAPQQVQRFSESPALDNGSQGDAPQQVQRFSELSALDSGSQSDAPQQVQRFSESPALENVSQSDAPQQVQRFSESPVLENVSQSDAPQQVQRFSESPVLENVSQGDRTIQDSDSNIIQTPQTALIQSQSDISTGDNISQPPVLENVSQSDAPQQVQRFSEAPALDSGSQSDRTIQDSDSNIIQTPQIDAIQRESDISAVSDISQVDQNIQRFSESPVLDDLLQSDRTIQRETNSNITQPTQTDSLQTQPDILAVSDILQGNYSQSIQRKVEANNQENTIVNSENKTIIQMMRDPSNTADLKLPKAIENLSQTEYLGNFSPLTPSKTTSSKSSQTVQRSQIDRPSPNSLSNSLNNLPQIIQPKQDQNPDSNQTNSIVWSNIAELLANLPLTKSSSNPPASSLNNQKTSDRSPLATKPASVSSTSNQTTIQRSLDQNDIDSDQDLYITPTGIQKGKPNKIINTQSPTVQRKINADQLPEATVSVEPRQDQNQDAENFDQNLETLAQEIYILLKQRLETEKERQGTRYQGRLPW